MELLNGFFALLIITMVLIAIFTPSISLFWKNGRTTRGTNFLLCLLFLLTTTILVPLNKNGTSKEITKFHSITPVNKDNIQKGNPNTKLSNAFVSDNEVIIPIK